MIRKQVCRPPGRRTSARLWAGGHRLKKRVTIVVAVIAAAGTAALLVARSQSPQSPTSGSTDLQRETGASGWPADRTFAWSFKTPEDDSKPYGLSLRIRAKTTALAAGTTPALLAPSSAMPATDAELEFGPGSLVMPGGQSGSGHVTVQLLDLSKVGAASSKPGQDLRLLASVSLGGGRIDLPTDRIFLPAGSFAGNSSQGKGTWTKGELYLMSFYVQDDRKFTQYDVLLEKSAERPAH